MDFVLESTRCRGLYFAEWDPGAPWNSKMTGRVEHAKVFQLFIVDGSPDVVPKPPPGDWLPVPISKKKGAA